VVHVTDASLDPQVKSTMKAIKHTLTERFYSWEDAVKLAKLDPEIDLSGKGPTYTPLEYVEDEVMEPDDPVDGTETQKADLLGQQEMDPAAIPPKSSTPQESPRV
jgi:large subunit ribosomal protein L47